MTLKYIENTGSNPKMIGGRLIPPGEGREVEVDDLPPEHQDVPGGEETKAAANANLVDLLQGSVADVTAALPDFSNETLDELAALEAEGKARKGVLEAVAALKLERAGSKTGEVK